MACASPWCGMASASTTGGMAYASTTTHIRIKDAVLGSWTLQYGNTEVNMVLEAHLFYHSNLKTTPIWSLVAIFVDKY